MAKIHSNYPAVELPATETAVTTVWRKSLLFNCNGFTVYDAKGNLTFRVDNYSSSSNGNIVLMDAYGKCLMTIRRKRLSIVENWLVYNGEETSNPRFTIKSHLSLLHSKVLAHVMSSSGPTQRGHRHSYSVEGAYSQHQCTIYDDRHRPVGEVRRKEAATGIALGCDVFRLVVQAEMDATLAMAIVIALEQMYG